MGATLRIVNRLLLGLTGAALAGFGLAALAAALDLPRRWGIGLPSRWAWQGPQDVLLRRADRLRWQDEAWWWPMVIGGLVLLVLMLLWWLLAQARRRRLTEVLVDSGDGVGALLRGRAMEDVMTSEAEALPGVDRAQVTLVGARTRPRARIGALLTPQSRPGEIVTRLRTESVARARTSAGLDHLPAEVRLRAAGRGGERVN